MVYNSLTDIPRNLKEGIDWLIALKGTDGEKNLAAMGAAVYNFLAPCLPERVAEEVVGDAAKGVLNNPVGNPADSKPFLALEHIKLISMGYMWQKELRELWPANVMLKLFIKFIDKKPSELANTIKDNPETVTEKLGKIVNGCEKFVSDIKHPEQYKSAYGKNATWVKSCSQNPEDCAAVFVGIAPMLYVGLESLRDASQDAKKAEPSEAGENFRKVLKAVGLKDRGSSNDSSDLDEAQNRLGEVLQAMGYEQRRIRDSMRGSYVLQSLSVLDHDLLNSLYDISGFDVTIEWGLRKSKSKSTTNVSAYWPAL
ncbi:hypothetical protein BBBOND_0313390 [Babesia bigemina]|uniref:Uncharacterized protein n=1 Tax=Babesia bigemina TaxID=5866 RepID=A0A061DBU0_BABBI|nr:hypothetical protein BBBOND_0313390 [Babesia bigemina]CDR97437.1 hypothetical protein BBBOND_0313390 [Babesia bigemina]|eukprot:XP_012769623.1 hypothetical protein BBBOND_0313390 [Babesia bigemina]